MPQGDSYLEVKACEAPSHKKVIKEHRDLFWYYISERQQIWEARQNGMSPPWTEDPILRNYHFTNVFREEDKGTRRLVEFIEDPEWCFITDTKEAIIWIIVQYRWPNYHTLMESYGVIPHGFKKKRWLKRIERVKRDEGKWHTSAHIVLQSNFKQSRAENFLQYLGLLDDSFDEFCNGILGAPTMESAFKHIKKFKGFGGFTAYEILIDMCRSGILPIDFLDEFANPGPGCKEGIDLIYPSRTNLSYAEAMEKLRDNQDRAFDRLGLVAPDTRGGRRLTLQDIEFSLCEFSKYWKIKHNLGRRRRYRAAV